MSKLSATGLKLVWSIMFCIFWSLFWIFDCSSSLYHSSNSRPGLSHPWSEPSFGSLTVDPKSSAFLVPPLCSSFFHPQYFYDRRSLQSGKSLSPFCLHRFSRVSCIFLSRLHETSPIFGEFPPRFKTTPFHQKIVPIRARHLCPTTFSSCLDPYV